MSFPLVTMVILVLAVVFVNGWTDAPNVIATVVSTRSMQPKKAVFMAAIFNFLGLFCMTTLNSKVASTIGNIVIFSSGIESQVALAAGLFAIVVWAVTAWYFGIPTSESHALIAGITGAGISITGFNAVNLSEWTKVLYGLVISSVIGVLFGYLSITIVNFLFKNIERHRANIFFKNAQISSGAAMAFLHGAQDGQKFLGVFMLGTFLAKGQEIPITFNISIYVIVLFSIVMGIGTSIGGYKIIKVVGMDMVKLEKHEGFAADTAAAICLLFSTITGIPLSTTHTKTTAVMGVGAAKRMSNLNWKIVNEMVLAWLLTFPGCIIIGYLMSKLFIFIF
ncbi:MAG: inorganic phosphate transporter [Clostridia bacterium]|nr:inorganic phosphate transporter [Clostridia bacterium]